MIEGEITNAGEPAGLWEGRPWRIWLAGAALFVVAGSFAGAFLMDAASQARIAQFMIPPYSYSCLGLAVIALTELQETLRRRVLMALILAGLAPVSVLSYSVGGFGSLLVLGVHLGFMIGWVAWKRKMGWTWFWLAEVLAWIALAASQGRLTS